MTTVEEAMVRRPKTHAPEATAADIAEFFADSRVHMALIVSPDGQLVSTVERGDLQAARSWATPASVLGRLTGRTVAAGASLEVVVEYLRSRGKRRLGVVDDDGNLLGLFCLKADRTGYCTDAGVESRAAERPFD